MRQFDPLSVAARLTTHEKAALASLPIHDRGHWPDELWWAYYAILDYGLATSNGDFELVASPLGEAVLRALGETRP
jgi:hypothetical protein